MTKSSREFPSGLATELQRIVGTNRFSRDTAERIAYSYDNSRRQGAAGAVAFAETEQEVAAAVRACHEFGWPLVVRGLGSNTVGATIPVDGALVLSMERMSRIDPVNRADRYLIAEAGATNAAVQSVARAAGFFWPPDPTSSAYSTLGGNLACNAAGPHAVKYGTPRENVLGLRAVTGEGEIIAVGTRTTKGVVGYDLTRLLLGSEGTLAIITQATLKLWPWPEAVATLRAAYTSVGAAADAVANIMSQSDLPWVLEFLDRESVSLVRAQGVVLPSQVEAILLIEVEGSPTLLERVSQSVSTAAQVDGCIGVEIARDREQAENLWRARRALSPALRTLRPGKINEDVVVPVSRVPDLIESLDQISRQCDLPIVSFGHVGNGNLHVNILFDPDKPAETRAGREALPKVFASVLQLGGTLSGEHGVGLAKRDYVGMELSRPVIELMRGVKRVFDPDNILNPGKVLPSDLPSEGRF